MENRPDIVFTDDEISVIAILINSEIREYDKRLEENDFNDRYDRSSAEYYLKTLIEINKKINKKEGR